MLTIGKLIDDLEPECSQLESESRESILSFLDYDFELELTLDNNTDQYVAQIKECSSSPVSLRSNLKYLHCFNRDLPIMTEPKGFGSGSHVHMVASNSSCGKVEFCLMPNE